MKRLFLSTILTCMFMAAHAQEQGITFTDDTWAETIARAKVENKLIFVDFYTAWCGPCYNMAKTVFTMHDVGNFYNTHFINAKIDAENGEGVELARKYGVHSYPTYAFIDPNTEEMVHRSGSRQTAAQFIRTGQSALNPQTRSFYLDDQYAAGNRERTFLMNYIAYKSSIYARKDVLQAFEELLKQASLTEQEVWDLYVAGITGNNNYTRYISDHYTEFCNALGREAVDAKLCADTQYGDPKDIASLCNFSGKAFNIEMIHINNLLRNEQYDAATLRIDSLIADPQTDRRKLSDRLKYIARVAYRRDTYPDSWFLKCVEYLQYVAYNHTDRDDASIHQEYASTLEMLIKRMAEGKCQAPACIIAGPAHGKTEYDMRPDDLAKKPKKGIKQ